MCVCVCGIFAFQVDELPLIILHINVGHNIEINILYSIVSTVNCCEVLCMPSGELIESLDIA